LSKRKDTDYLFISTYLRALENKMLTKERMERMLEARTNEDAAKVLSECGYDGLEPLSQEALEQSLSRNRAAIFGELASLAPNPRLVDVFRMRYDYHNAKAIIKCAATNQDPARLLSDAGRVSPEVLLGGFTRGDYNEVPDALRQAMEDASQRLSATGDPQRCDFLLDRAYYGELSQAAKDSGSSFLQEYVQLMIDAANLRAAVRTLRMHKGIDLLSAVIVPGGSVSTSAISAAVLSGGNLEGVFVGPLQNAAVLGDAAIHGGRQTAFEKACDDALVTFLQKSRMTPFGDSVLASYLAAKENEISAARIILSGRLSGVPTESIRERLREAYV
jgi:V/A-type H+-transporting ATPase subunit C